MVWVAGITMLVLFTGTFGYAFFGKHGAANLIENEPASRNLAMATEAVAYAEKDTDGDGLADWEELLWGTNPNDPDSDGNGVLDGEEERASTAPDAPMQTYGPGSFSQTADTATQVAARELLGTYLTQVRYANVDLSDEEQGLVATQALETAVREYVPPTIDESDLTIVSASRATQAEYIMRVAKLIVAMGAKPTNDLELMQQLVGEDVRYAASSLVASSNFMRAVVDELRKVPVPTDAVNVHLNLVNSFLGYIATVENISTIQTDPLRAGIGAQLLVGYAERLDESVEDLQAYGNSRFAV